MSMTIEETIAQYEQITNFCEHYGLTTSQEEIEQLVAWLRELAERRKAQLSQEGTTSDLIDRQAALETLRTMQTYKLHEDDDMILVDKADVQTELMMMPSVQPETAKRIVGKSRDGMTLWYQCDMCNEPVDEQDDYCRGCGRRLIDG